MAAVMPLFVSQKPPSVLDGPHSTHVQMLPWGAGIAVPAVIADVYEHLGPVFGEMPHLVCEHGLIADENTVSVLAARLRGEHGGAPVLAARKLPHAPGQFMSKGKQIFKRYVFAKRYQVDL